MKYGAEGVCAKIPFSLFPSPIIKATRSHRFDLVSMWSIPYDISLTNIGDPGKGPSENGEISFQTARVLLFIILKFEKG